MIGEALRRWRRRRRWRRCTYPAGLNPLMIGEALRLVTKATTVATIPIASQSPNDRGSAATAHVDRRVRAGTLYRSLNPLMIGEALRRPTLNPYTGRPTSSLNPLMIGEALRQPLRNPLQTSRECPCLNPLMIGEALRLSNSDSPTGLRSCPSQSPNDRGSAATAVVRAWRAWAWAWLVSIP